MLRSRTQEQWMGWIWRRDQDRIRAGWSAARPLLPLLAILALFVVHFVDSRPLRTCALGAAVFFCLFIIGDLARSLLDPDLNNLFLRGKDTPVTTLQIVLVILLALFYTFLILIVMSYLVGSMVWPYYPTTAVCVLIGAFLFSCCAAWQNVRLWRGQAVGYAENLKELDKEERRRWPQNISS